MTKFQQGQAELMRQAVKDALAVDSVRARLGRTVELLAEEPPMRRFAQEMEIGGVELRADVEPLVAALRATPDNFWSSLEKLAEAVRECSPALRHAYAGDRLGELFRVFAHAHLALAWGVNPSQFVAEIPDRIDHHLPDNPITITPEGAVEGWGTADMPHFQQLRDYRSSLRPAGKPGRPPKDVELAAVVYAKDLDGKHWKEIARTVGLRDHEGRPYDLYDPKDAKRAYSRVRALIERGRLTADSEDSAQESP